MTPEQMIYRTFKQWVKGRFLETGEPRKQAYSKDELALIEMGWNYGHDAGVAWQKGQQALDKKAENAKELGLDYEPVAWGVHDQIALNKTLAENLQQRTWVGLTDDEIVECWARPTMWATAHAIEAKLKDKNENRMG